MSVSAFVFRGDPMGTTNVSPHSVPPVAGNFRVEHRDIARPRDRGDRVARHEVLHVLVALDAKDLTGYNVLLEHLDRGSKLVLAPLRTRNVHALTEQNEAHRVAHFAQNSDLALERWVPQVVESL
jgi:hypothetical protein